MLCFYPHLWFSANYSKIFNNFTISNKLAFEKAEYITRKCLEKWGKCHFSRTCRVILFTWHNFSMLFSTTVTVKSWDLYKKLYIWLVVRNIVEDKFVILENNSGLRKDLLTLQRSMTHKHVQTIKYKSISSSKLSGFYLHIQNFNSRHFLIWKKKVSSCCDQGPTHRVCVEWCGVNESVQNHSAKA